MCQGIRGCDRLKPPNMPLGLIPIRIRIMDTNYNNKTVKYNLNIEFKYNDNIAIKQLFFYRHMLFDLMHCVSKNVPRLQLAIIFT